MLKLLLRSNFGNTCRLCLSEPQNQPVDIFKVKPVSTAKTKTAQVYIKIMCCAAVQVSNDDELPQQICGNCLKKLNEFCEFRELIEFSDEKLRKVLQVPFKPRGTPNQDCNETTQESTRPLEAEPETRLDSDCSEVESRLGDETPDEDVAKDSTSRCPRGRSNPQHTPDFYICDVCSTACKTAISLKAHKKIHDGKTLTCSDCGKVFAYKRLLSQHILTHQTDRAFLCAECGKSFKTKAQMKVHARRHFNDRPYPCRFCDKRFFQASHCSQHLLLHTGEQPFSCHRCGKSFRNQTGLKGHLRRHDGIMPYKCDTCGKQFALKSSKKNHARLHFGEKPYRCNVCDRSFALSSSLRVHMRIHSEDAASVCEVCGKRFASVRHLTEHARIHSERREYVCVTCGKAFKQAVGLTMHMKTHSEERPYKCDLCDKSFVMRQTFEVHYRRHSGVKPYACKICLKTFRQSATLRSHMSVHLAPRGLEARQQQVFERPEYEKRPDSYYEHQLLQS